MIKIKKILGDLVFEFKIDFSILKGDDKIKYIILIYLCCMLSLQIGQLASGTWYLYAFGLAPPIIFMSFRYWLLKKYETKKIKIKWCGYLKSQ